MGWETNGWAITFHFSCVASPYGVGCNRSISGLVDLCVYSSFAAAVEIWNRLRFGVMRLLFIDYKLLV